jgi:hypothetical protein
LTYFLSAIVAYRHTYFFPSYPSYTFLPVIPLIYFSSLLYTLSCHVLSNQKRHRHSRY